MTNYRLLNLIMLTDCNSVVHQVDNCPIYLAISSVLDQVGPLNRIYLEKIEIYSRASNLYKRYRITLSTWRGRENKYEDLEVI